MIGYSSKSVPLMVKFPSSKAALTTIGFALLNIDGSIFKPRTSVAASDNGDGYANTAVVDLGNGYYTTSITVPEPWIGSVLWDTGESEPLKAAEEIIISPEYPEADSAITLTSEEREAIATAVWSAPLPDDYPSGSAGNIFGHIGGGLVVVIPAPTIPGVQTLVITAKELGPKWASGDPVTITPLPCQHVGQNIISTQYTRAIIGVSGIAEVNGVPGIPVDMGAKIKVRVGDYYCKTITVDDTPIKNIVDYP